MKISGFYPRDAGPRLTLLITVAVLATIIGSALSTTTSNTNSNVYYLQDYCEELVEPVPEKEIVRQRRNIFDHDSDHDHDHDFRSGIHHIRSYYMNKTAKLIKSEIKFQKKMLKKQIKLEEKNEKLRKKFVKKLRKKIKQIHLDPIVQPSIVIRSWRDKSAAAIAERLRRTNQTLNKIRDGRRKLRRRRMKRICQILLKLPANTELEQNLVTRSTQKNVTSKLHRVPLTHFGTVINFQKMDHRSKSGSPETTLTGTQTTDSPLTPEEEKADSSSKKHRFSHNIRIITSDPNMTQYWFQGERLVLDDATTTSEPESKESEQPESGANKPEVSSIKPESINSNSDSVNSAEKNDSSMTNIDIIDEGIMLEPILKHLNGEDNDTGSTEIRASTEAPGTSGTHESTDKEEIKWLLIQLDTSEIDTDNDSGEMNDTDSELSDLDILDEDEDDYFDDNETDLFDDDDDELEEAQQIELIINLYQAMKQLYRNDSKSTSTSEESSKNTAESNSNPGSTKVKQASNCPIGTFDCASDGTQCIPNSLRCNGEDNCGNRQDELQNCGTINLYYIFGSGMSHGDGNSQTNQIAEYIDLNSEGIWFGLQILAILFIAITMMYCLSLCCRFCDRKQRYGKYGYDQLTEHPTHRSIYVNKSGQRMFSSGNNGGTPTETQWLSSSWSRQFRPSAPDNPQYQQHQHQQFQQQYPQAPPPPYNQTPGRLPNFLGNQSDNQRSVVNEHIYVNNNYGQPLGSTTVATTVRPSVGQSPFSNVQDYPPMYPNMGENQQNGPMVPNYGGINEKC